MKRTREQRGRNGEKGRRIKKGIRVRKIDLGRETKNEEKKEGERWKGKRESEIEEE